MKDTYSVPLGVSLADPIILPICKDTFGFRSSPRQQPKIASTILLLLRLAEHLNFDELFHVYILFLCILVSYVF